MVIETKNAARQIGVTTMQFGRYLRNGFLPTARQLPNGVWIVTQEAVDRFLIERAAGKFPRRGLHKINSKTGKVKVSFK